MKQGNLALFLVFCSFGGYVCGMSDAPKRARTTRVFTVTQGKLSQVIPLEPGSLFVLDNNGFSQGLAKSSCARARNDSLKRKPLSDFGNTQSVFKKSETTQQVHRKAMSEIVAQSTPQTAEEKLLAMCNAQSKKRGLGITLMSLPKDLVVEVKTKNSFIEERIVPPMQPASPLNRRENDAVAGLLSISYGPTLF